MLGLIAPDAGRVLFQGEELTRRRVLAVRRRMGYVIQSGGLFPHLTAERNVTLLARQLGWEAGRTAERVRRLCELTHFPTDGLSRYPVQLSGGQQQRVALMRALMLDPDVLLLDEPLGALDPLIRADLQTDLKEVFTSLGKTVVLVTHDLGEAAFFGDRVVLLREGHIVQQGTLDDFIERPADPFVSRFLRAQRGAIQPAEAAR
jgi:osmoprotectant transport system ATP-binding protein